MHTKRIIAFNLIAFNDVKAVGTMVFTRRLLSELNRYKDIEDYKIIIYLQQHINPDDFFIPNNCEVEIIKVPSLLSATKRILFEQTLFYKYLRKCDVFFTPTLSMPLFAKGKKIFTLHDMVPYVVKGKYSKTRQAYIKSITWLYSRMADRILTVSESSKKDIINYLHLKSNKVDVMYNFITENEDVVKRNTQLNVEISKPYFLTVSTLQPAKNLDQLIRAFDIFNKTQPNYKLYIVGNKGWGYELLFKLTEELNLIDNIIFTGYMDDVALSAMYEQCEAVVYVSLYEGFGLPPLEGFYHNKVCVASNISSLPEVVGGAGILVDPQNEQAIAQAMHEVLEKKIQLSKQINVQKAKFNPQIQVSKFIKIINR